MLRVERLREPQVSHLERLITAKIVEYGASPPAEQKLFPRAMECLETCRHFSPTPGGTWFFLRSLC